MALIFHLQKGREGISESNPLPPSKALTHWDFLLRVRVFQHSFGQPKADACHSKITF
jgi:hypothetical protein